MNLTDITNFSTVSFLVFITIAFLIFWSVPQKFKTLWLLFASYAFYASYFIGHIGILLLTTLLDFYFGQIIHRRKLINKQIHFFVFTCVIANLSMLIYFKYRFFFFPSLAELSYQSILLPLGLSFFTLQSIGYILDISRGKLEPETSLVKYALFVSFFPQIIAGPIEKAQEIIPQYKKIFRFNSINWNLIIYLFAWGFFKKYIVADNLAVVLANIKIDSQSSLLLKHLSLVFFFIRIYCDFSGYTDMARAIAQLFTVNLRENFNFPLFANSPQDFWDRWHMSLGRWIKNYFYTPLLLAITNPYWAILIVFPVMGLWHGANINFLIWGFSWALIIIIFKLLKINKLSSLKYLNYFIMFNISSLLMVFFKAKNFVELKSYLYLDFSQVVSADLNTLLAVSFLPLIVIIYELLLFILNDKYYLLKKSLMWQIIFYMFILFFYYSFSNVDSQQIFYLQF